MAIIRRPGKFEGELSYAPTLWCMMLDAASDETLYDGDTPLDVFVVDATLRKTLLEGWSSDAEKADPADVAELNDGDVLILTQSEQGFVDVSVHTAEELDDIRRELAEAGAEESEQP